MTIGRWLYASGIMLCVFQAEALAASEALALARDALFLIALALIWREAAEARLLECGWLLLVASWLGTAINGTPVSATMAFTALAMLLAGYRLRWLPAGERTRA